MFQRLPVFSSKLFVWAFIPYRITEQGLVGEFYDNPGYRQELADVFTELGIQWKWQPITLENIHAAVEEVAASSKEYIPVVLNFCDGFDEVDGYPGLSVIKLLEEKNIIFTGSDSTFEYLTISKIRMKCALAEASVSTAPYEVISDISHVRGICQRLGIPLIVKPAISTASYGIWLQSVVHSDEQVRSQVQQLLQGQHGMECPPEGIFVEQFINGPEFTVLLVGSAQQPDSIKIYPPVERVFHPSLPETERFLVSERQFSKEATSLWPEEQVCRHQLADPILRNRLRELSRRAYCAVGGIGYGRVDIRMEWATQELFVLEVNSNCALSSTPIPEQRDSRKSEEPHETSAGTILHLSGTPFAQLMSEIIAEAFARNSSKSRKREVSV